jgi:hypothetical protein
MDQMTFDTIYSPRRFRPKHHQLLLNPGFIRPDPDKSDEGWKIQKFARINWDEAIEPASPEEFQLT